MIIGIIIISYSSYDHNHHHHYYSHHQMLSPQLLSNNPMRARRVGLWGDHCGHCICNPPDHYPLFINDHNHDHHKYNGLWVRLNVKSKLINFYKLWNKKVKVTFPLKMRVKVDIFLFPILHWTWTTMQWCKLDIVTLLMTARLTCGRPETPATSLSIIIIVKS